MPDSTSNSRSRRAFFKEIGVAGMSATLAAETALAQTVAHDDVKQTESAEFAEAPVSAAEILVPVTLNINGKKREVRVDPRASLLDTLRETVQLTGTKKGCDHGQCGACTVHSDGKRVLSCMTPVLCAQGHEITTIEGLGTPEKMHPMQAAFVEHDGYQCGYCTSGQIMSAVALMKEPVGATDAELRDAMSGNICRCGAYQNILAAIQQVRKVG